MNVHVAMAVVILSVIRALTLAGHRMNMTAVVGWCAEAMPATLAAMTDATLHIFVHIIFQTFR